MRTILSLGESQKRYGEYRIDEAEGGVVGFLSVGNDPASPSHAFKGSPDYPNEDGYLVLTEEHRILVAVADSHFGHQASHEMLTRLAQRCPGIPRSPEELAPLLLNLAEPDWVDGSSTTLLVAVVERQSRQGFGFSWGDSSLLALGQTVRALSAAEGVFYLGCHVPPDLTKAKALSFTLGPGEWLVAFTDGINECHYRCPLTSIAERHLMQLRRRARDATSFGAALMELALHGVDENPGGQDNIALVVVALD